MSAREQQDMARQDTAITAVADALLSVCALQTGLDPMDSYHRAIGALLAVIQHGADEQYGHGAARVVPTAGSFRIEFARFDHLGQPE